jgi:hypothetical protein
MRFLKASSSRGLLRRGGNFLSEARRIMANIVELIVIGPTTGKVRSDGNEAVVHGIQNT